MATTRKTRTISADPDRVWEVIGDPHHLPRWWPGVTRMEAVEDDRWTQVLKTKKGRPVRMDFRLLTSEPPDPSGAAVGQRAWEQELAGSPFERVLSQSITEIVLEREGEGTRVTIEQRQRLRGYSRTGGFLLRRATGTKLDEALEGLQRVCG
jgi:uncharacterized protein YndB with AHSA1/START domain